MTESIVLKETFHALAQYHIQKEWIYDFLDQLLEKLIAGKRGLTLERRNKHF